MTTFVTILHVVVCVFLVVIVLLQHGKGADVGATFGGAGNTVFGSRGAATFLSKLTVACAVIFMLTSVGLAYLSSRATSDSVLADQPKEVQKAGSDSSATVSPTTAPSAVVSPAAETKQKTIKVKLTPEPVKTTP